jgi:outer membrane immunogenic protein
MKFASTILGFATAAALSTTALAADLPARVVKPGIAPAASCFWAGPYLGAQVGYTWNNMSTNIGDLNGNRTKADHNKITGGVYGGYNFCLTPGLIGGIELEATKYGNSPKRNFSAFGNNIYTNSDTNFGGSAVVRLGLPVDRALFYVKGGVGFAQQKAYVVETGLLAPGVAFADVYRKSKTGFGYVVGAGVDYAFTNNWVGRLGYTYFDAGRNSFEGIKVTNKYHTVNVGLAYKF